MRELMSIAIVIGAVALSAGCGSKTEDVHTVEPPATGQALPGVLAAPKVGMVAGNAEGERFKMSFVIGGGVPPMEGADHKINTPPDSE